MLQQRRVAVIRFGCRRRSKASTIFGMMISAARSACIAVPSRWSTAIPNPASLSMSRSLRPLPMQTDDMLPNRRTYSALPSSSLPGGRTWTVKVGAGKGLVYAAEGIGGNDVDPEMFGQESEQIGNPADQPTVKGQGAVIIKDKMGKTQTAKIRYIDLDHGLPSRPDQAAVLQFDNGVGNSGNLVKIMGYQQNGAGLFQLQQQLFDCLRGCMIQGRGRFIEEQHLGLENQSPGNAQSLLLSSRKIKRRGIEPVMHLIPEPHLLQTFHHPASDNFFRYAPFKLQGKGDILVDAHGQRIGNLKYHADLSAQLGNRVVFLVNILKPAVKLHLNNSLQGAVGNRFPESVQGHEKGRFS